ncbi:hypothetical protein ACTMU2_01280 [Cupriavidus basilensis]
MRPDHPLARFRSITLAQMQPYPLALPERRQHRAPALRHRLRRARHRLRARTGEQSVRDADQLQCCTAAGCRSRVASRSVIACVVANCTPQRSASAA